MLETLLPTIDITSLLIVAIFFLLLEYRPPWWRHRTKQQINEEYLKNQRRKGVSGIPGPPALPFVGTGYLTSFGMGSTFDRLHEFYRDMHLKYGPIVKEEAVGNVPVVHLFDRADIERVARGGGRHPLRPPVEAMASYRRGRPDRYASIGLVNEQGPAWHYLRTSLTPVLTSPRTVSTFLPQVHEIAEDWCTLVRNHRDPQTGAITDLKSIADLLALEITCALVLGRRMGFLIPGAESEIARQLAEATRDHFLATRDTYFGLPLWKIFNTSTYRRLVKAEERIYELALELVRTADDSTRDSVVFQTIVNSKMDEREKTAAIVDFMAAGIHTMKNSFVFLLHAVAQKSDFQAKIIADTSADVYVKACLMESFRLYPTANSMCRVLEEDMDLGGFRVDKGSVVVCQWSIACQDELNFDRPLDFCPDRWLDRSHPDSFLVLPFGAGRRICPGKRLIEHILPVLLKATVEQFELESNEKMEIQFEFLLTPKGPLHVTFKDRTD